MPLAGSPLTTCETVFDGGVGVGDDNGVGVVVSVGVDGGVGVGVGESTGWPKSGAQATLGAPPPTPCAPLLSLTELNPASFQFVTTFKRLMSLKRSPDSRLSPKPYP